MKFLINTVHAFYKIYWFVFRPKTYGVKGLVIKNEQVLLVKNSYGNLLYLPGGGVKKEESPEDAVKRELKEETGIEVLKCHLVGKYVSDREYKKDNISLFYIDEFKESDKNKSIEIDSVSFYPINNLPENVSSTNRKRININPEKVDQGKW